MSRRILSSLWAQYPRKIGGATHFLQCQKRAFSNHMQQVRPDVGGIYKQLLHKPLDSEPVACNFISQVVDIWADDPVKVAIQSIGLDTGSQEEITYAELVKKSKQLAQFFREKGIKKGDSVALMLGQHPSWWYSLAGLMRGGVAVVPCPRLLTKKDLAYRIRDLGIRGIITSPEQESRVDSIRDICPTLSHFLTTGERNENWSSLVDVFNVEPEEVGSCTTTEDSCLYLYTSGTTGQPKAVQHNADYPFFHWPTGRKWLGATSEDLIYNASDTGWGFTVWITTAAWAMGSRLLVTPTNKKFDPQKMLSILSGEPISIFCAAPTVLRLLVAERNFDCFKFPCLKRIVTVGEALDDVVIQKFESLGVKVAVGFGQAETPLLMGRTIHDPHVSGTMGKPMDPYKVVALDDNNQPVSPGNIGQIAVDLLEGESAGVMRGYANAPRQTEESFSHDGRYYLTGDWAEYRRDGLFSYQGRRDDLIKSSGYRIGPDEVEKAGMSHPAVAKIAVVGVPEDRDSSAVIVVKAFVLLKPNEVESHCLMRSIQEYIKQETAPHKYPRLIEFLSPIEWGKYETTSGKIRRAGLREREWLSLKNKLPEKNLTDMACDMNNR